MRITFCFLILFAGMLHSYGQNSQIDSNVLIGLKSINEKYSDNPVMGIRKQKELIILARNLNTPESWIQERISYYIGQNYSKIGDFDRSLEIYRNCAAFFIQAQDYENLAWTYNDMGIAFSNQSMHDSALYYAEKGLDLAIEHKIDYLLADFHGGVAYNLVHLNRLDKALTYLKEVEYIISHKPALIIEETKVYYFQTKGLYFHKKGQQNNAIANYLKAENIADKHAPRKALDVRNNLAGLFLTSGNPLMAKSMLLKNIASIGIDTNANIKETYLLQCFSSLAKSYFDLNELDSALYYVDKAEEQFDFFHAQYMFNTSKLFHNDFRRSNLSLGVEIAFQRYKQTGGESYMKQSLRFADKAKSNVLNERMHTSELLRNSKISASIIEKRFSWIHLLNNYETDGNVAGAIKLRNKLDSLDKALGLRQIQIYNDSYVQSLQASLNEDHVVIEYFIADNKLYTFTISNTQLSVKQSEFNVSEKVMLFYQMVQDPTVKIDLFEHIGFELKSLLLPSDIAFKNQYTKLTIIPDGVLYYLPFEAMIHSTSSAKIWSQLDYIGLSYTVTYDFSLQTFSRKLNTFGHYSYVGFAPQFNNNPALTYLTHGREVTEMGRKLFGGQVFEDEQATSIDLKEFGLNADILQLYTHAVSSDSSYNASYIQLADKKVFVDEIMTMHFKNQLCLLTACEVGMGKNYSGEGVTGVAWAFRAAGAQNVVQSLWRINQVSSATLMENFFQSLSNKQTSARALKHAKQDYLNNSDISERLKHPYYWAGMSHFGPGTTINKKRNFNWLLIGVIGLLIVYLVVKVNSKLMSKRKEIH